MFESKLQDSILEVRVVSWHKNTLDHSMWKTVHQRLRWPGRSTCNWETDALVLNNRALCTDPSSFAACAFRHRVKPARPSPAPPKLQTAVKATC